MTLSALHSVPSPLTQPPVPRYGNPVVLVAHGSRDPRSAHTMRALGDAVALRWPAPVTTAFLDFNTPTVPAALQDVAGPAMPIVVPALLTHAYHGRVDLPEVLSCVDIPTRVASVLGPSEPGMAADPLLVAALIRRLSELDVGYDGLVLLAAGTSQPEARSTVESVATALSMLLHVVCVVGYASASSPSGADAVRAANALGARRVAAASYFLAAGRLYDAAAASAHSAGAVGVAEPLGDAAELVELIVRRAAVHRG
jgi:sirohydrochlorin ferrochelatase